MLLVLGICRRFRHEFRQANDFVVLRLARCRGRRPECSRLTEVASSPRRLSNCGCRPTDVCKSFKIDLDNVERGTVIYAEYIKGIVDELETALSAAGWRVGQYTGEQKAGLAQFQAGEIDVLIGSRAVGTGVDGLQHCANTLIIASAP